MDIGIALALCAAGAYGASDFIGGVGSRRHTSWQVVFVGQSASAIVMLVAGLVLPGSPIAADFGWALLAGVGSAAGSIFLYRGLARGRMGLVAPISAVGAAVLPILAGVIFGERPSLVTWGGMVVALPGIWLVSRSSASDQTTHRRAAVLDGVLAGVGFGVLFIALAQISDGAGLMPLVANQLTGAVLTIATAASLKQVWRPTRGVLGWGSGSGVLGALATLAFTVATGLTALGIAGVLASLYPAVTVLLAAGFLRERVTISQQAGIGICTLAIAAMALG